MTGPDREGFERRGFVKLCAGAVVSVAATPSVLANGTEGWREYPHARLVSGGGSKAPVRLTDLEIGKAYVFHYPYIATPCFLIDLGRPVAGDGDLLTEDGASYRWPGGIGPKRSVVAFAAICQHKMTHPSRPVTFIDYRHESTSYRDSDQALVEREGVIYCCSERSVYDPAAGGRVLGGPARQPLTAIAIAHDEDEDAIVATGTRGGEIYDRFFEAFENRLALEYRTDRVPDPIGRVSELVPLEEFSAWRRIC